jgi:hypothetical protein
VGHAIAKPEAAKPEAARGDGTTLTLVRPTFSGLDRWLPAKERPFLALVGGVVLLFWVAGYLLAADKSRFLASREWWVQPVYLALHLVLLRMFVAVYAGNFVAGCAHLDVSRAATERHVRTTLGWPSVVAALVLATPLVWLDLRWMAGDEYLGAKAGMGVEGALGAADVLMAAAWAVEWLVTTYLWALIVAFLVRAMVVLTRHEFKDPVHRVLRERQYRPFLLMSAQGASLIAGFAVASVLYVWLAKGALSDYAALWVTGGLVLVGFVPPWMRLKSRLGAAVDAEASRLGEVLEEETDRLDAKPPSRRRTLEDVGARVDALLATVRVEDLRRLHESLGKVEAQAVLLRLLAPAVTVGWRLIRPF